ncbi:putative periplasmic iron-binding protein precursor [Candidatus Nitrosocosmicus oleophilus]|uniref:Putative periplasmic iron-binding protein n=1 Tax=Candidatus Nitrosocosmicus oleophilus TaxID=1353260 RepID=A0A654M624_9ARCH|nr:metal ABC transporter substrate-binding protein [Candidatus Nitrosocosmicus oleophilus]ALI34722.1 putative periplasmic iron-binding protein precursor [Candidatus Nitrosocosmicus oleophilus]
MSENFFKNTKIMFVATFTILLSLLAVVSSTSVDNNLNSVYAANKTLNVITSVSPITNIVKNIAGDKINLTGLVPEGVNSHTFEPVPSDIVKLSNADLVIINGLFLEDNMEKVVNESLKNKPDIQLLKLADGTINSTGWIFDFSFPKEQGHPNPHLWLNPVNAMKFANLTKDKLIEMDPNNTAYYAENAEKYIALLKQLDEGIKTAVQSVPPENRKLVTYHDSWAYFAPRYNMTVIGAVQPSDFSEPSPLDIAKLIDQIKAEKVPAIFASEVFSNRITDQIAKEAGVNIVQTLRDDALPGNLTSPNHTYVGMMLDNMENMVVPLGGNTSSLSNINPENTYTP